MRFAASRRATIRWPLTARIAGAVWTVALTAFLAACQTDGVEVLDLAPEPSAPVETVGSGATRIAILLPADSAAASATGDAARLAVQDLGSDAVTAVLYAGYPGTLTGAQIAAVAKSAGGVVAIGPPAANRIPFALASGGAYEFRLTEADSAVAGVVGAAGSRAAAVALLVAETPAATGIEQLVADRVAVFGGRVVASARFGDDGASVDAAVARLASAEKADIVLITGGRASPAAVIAALRSKAVAGRATKIVGTDAWPDAARGDKASEGVYIATLDRGELGPMAARYKAVYGREPDLQAAYVYDLVALSVGLTRTLGTSAFDRRVIENEKGFRGSTGVFRFRADGGNERLLALYRLRGGSLRLDRKALPSF
ncbi:MAG: hypothetical protein AB7I79_23445 [Rhizobiaceae bacterium]